MSSVGPSDFRQSNWSTIVNQEGHLRNVHFSRVTGRIESKSGLFGIFSQFVNKLLSLFPGYQLGLKKSAVLQALEFGMRSANRDQDEVIRRVARIIKPKLTPELQAKLQEWEKGVANPKPNGSDESDKAKRQNELGLQLLYAAGIGNEEKVIELLEQGAPLNIKNSDGFTALLLALRNGHTEAAKLLIKSGANVDAKDPEGSTPLYSAIKKMMPEVALALIERSAALGRISQRHDPYPHLALKYGLNEVGLKLISEYPSPDEKGIDGTTLLHLALECLNEKDHSTEIKGLIERSKDLQQTNCFRDTALHIAASHGNLEAARTLIEKTGSTGTQNIFGDTPLHNALNQGHYATAMLIIENSEDVNQVGRSGETALHIATRQGDLKTTCALIKKTADISGVNINGKSALSGALERGHHEIAMLLIDQCDFWDSPALLDVAQRGYTAAVEALMKKPSTIDVNYENRHGTTALHLAIFHGHLETAIALLNHGAEFNIKSSEMGEKGASHTAVEMCRQRGEAMAEVLKRIETIQNIKG